MQPMHHRDREPRMRCRKIEIFPKFCAGIHVVTENILGTKYCYILYFIRKLRQLDDESGLNTCQAEISWKRGCGYFLADTPSSWSISQLEHSVRNVAAESEPNHETMFRLSVAIKGT